MHLDPKFDRDKVLQMIVLLRNFLLMSGKKSLDVNLTGAFLCCQEVGKIMSNQRNGNIINIASTYGIVGPDQRIYKNKSNAIKIKIYLNLLVIVLQREA